MRNTLVGLSAVALSAIAFPAFAQDATPPSAPSNEPASASPATASPDAAPAPTSGFTVSGGATLVSDYRFRGVSQTNKRFAIQGTFTVAHSSGFYATVWSSSVDDYIANGGDAEVDLIGGFKKTFAGTTFDVGVLYYYYPGSGRAIIDDEDEGTTAVKYRSDFFEPYVDIAHTFGPVTAKLTANYAPKQSGSGLFSQIRQGPKEDSLYIAGDFSAAIPHTPFAMSAHIGHTFGPSYLVPFDANHVDANGFTKSYTDWNIGATYTWKALTFGVSYVDTNRNSLAGTNTEPVRNVTKAGVVGSVGVAF